MAPKDVFDDYVELRKKADLALKDPKLVEIAKTAPLNTKDQPNLTWAYKESLKYALGKITGLKEANELAISNRFLTKIRRDYPETFSNLIAGLPAKIEKSEKEIPKPPEKKRFDGIEFEIPDFAELITKEILEPDYGHFFTRSTPRKKRLIRFSSENNSSFKRYVREFCLDILNNLIEADSLEEKICIEQLIEILEKKGLKIKICGNCANYYCHQGTRCDQLGGLTSNQRASGDFCYFTPSKWTSKKSSDEKK